MALRLTFLVLIPLLLSGCFWNKKDTPKGSMYLGDLIPLQASSNNELVKVSTDEQIAMYKELLGYAETAQLRLQLLSRIADLELIYEEQMAERSLVVKADAAYLADYEKTITLYLDLLRDFPQNPGNDMIYYQLAKAYDMAGNTEKALAALTQLVTEFPESMLVVEANFRRGDYHFTLRQYPQAEMAFRQVVDAGKDTAFFENATYWLAWSHFKQGKYEEALLGFTDILDKHMPGNTHLDKLDKNRALLIEDSLRVVSIIFSYQLGADSLVAFYERQGERNYTPLVYRKLAALYERKERFSDAIKTYRAFIAAYPISDEAPVIANQIMATMRKGNFLQSVLAEKEKFIAAYGVHKPYYRIASDEARSYAKAHVYAYLDEVGRSYHARAIALQKRVKRYRKPPPKLLTQMNETFDKALFYHRLFIASFPSDWHAGEKAFLIAEIFAGRGELSQAIPAYESAAYDFPLHDLSEKSAYSAILAHRKLTSGKQDKSSEENRQLAAELAFVQHFQGSQYVRPILLRTIDTYYRQKNYIEAVRQADIFLAMNQDANAEERLMINLVLGHSSFELKNYQKAESYYVAAMKSLKKSDKRYAEVFKRTTASIYKQGENLAAAGDRLAAVEEFLRVGQFAPNSSYRKTAEYDAATYLIQEKQFKRAVSVLTDYRKRYDPSKRNLDITGKLIACHEGMKDFHLAAAELKRVHRDEKDPEKRREALFLSAEYYEKAGDLDAALTVYKNYSHQYPAPFDLAMETRFKLSEMYRKKNDAVRHRYWLEKMIVADKKAGNERTARSKYLAAYSRNIFAEDFRKAFYDIKLTLPLSRSLPKKKQAMEDALKRYQWILAYEIQEFSTQATYQVAEIYAQLSKDIMDSQRPKGLTELELEEYDLLLEEQAYPFEEKATEIHESNLENSWHGNFDAWVGRSISALATLFPGKYQKEENKGEFSNVIY